MAQCEKFVKQYGDSLHLVFRVLVGLMFFMHGAGKILGWFGGGKVAIGSLLGVAGLIELLGGLAILLGFWTRLAASLSALLMLAAYFKAHFPQGWNPLANGGELALLYFAAFIPLILHGAGKWRLEKKEKF